MSKNKYLRGKVIATVKDRGANQFDLRPDAADNNDNFFLVQALRAADCRK